MNDALFVKLIYFKCSLFLPLAQLRIEEITRALRTGDLGIPSNPENRSPSPEPVYDNAGKRLNTREVRARGKLEGERHKLILEMMKLNPEYKPPGDYKYYQKFAHCYLSILILSILT